jgi:hypothetical protein
MVRGSRSLIVLAVLVASIGGARAMTLAADDANIVELLAQSNDIVVGRVDSVTDGIDDRGIPYTEVTLRVGEAIRGSLYGDYKFRQFGLLAPRLTADGKRKMMPAPPGFPKYTPGEDVALFLRPRAAWTGFRMPAGVTQGKFNISAGRVDNAMGNAGLFKNVHLDQGVTVDGDKRLLATASGPLNPDAFLSFVRRAVRERWTETELMTRTDRHDGPRIPPISDPGDANGATPGEASFTKNAQVMQLDPNACVALPGFGR